MNKKSMLCRTSVVLVISSSLIGLPSLPALSQRSEADGTAYLFDGADCTTAGSHYLNKTEKSKSNSRISIDRQVYDPLFSMQARGESTITLSCRAKPGYSILDLQMGVADLSRQNNIELDVGVYQGGNLRYSYEKLRPGSTVNAVLDLNDPKVGRNPDNIAIEVSCPGPYNIRCDLTFVKARFYPGETRSSAAIGSSDQQPQASENQPPSSQTSRKDVPTPGSSRQDASGSQLLRKVGKTVEGEVNQGIGRFLRRILR